MVALLVARQGRELQRYNSNGGRLVVGCIPYKVRMEKKCIITNIAEAVEVLVISSQKGNGIMFPKGGWELDETITQAASREAMEEAGVQGHVEDVLGKWMYKSRSNGTYYEGIMYPLNVTEELLQWPEMNARKRRWVSVAEVMNRCEHLWMREALQVLVRRISSSNRPNSSPYSVSFTAASTDKALVCLCA